MWIQGHMHGSIFFHPKKIDGHRKSPCPRFIIKKVSNQTCKPCEYKGIKVLLNWASFYMRWFMSLWLQTGECWWDLNRSFYFLTWALLLSLVLKVKRPTTWNCWFFLDDATSNYIADVKNKLHQFSICLLILSGSYKERLVSWSS